MSHFQKNFLDTLTIFIAIYKSYIMYSGLALQLQIRKFPVQTLLTSSAGIWDTTSLLGSG